MYIGGLFAESFICTHISNGTFLWLISLFLWHLNIYNSSRNITWNEQERLLNQNYTHSSVSMHSKRWYKIQEMFSGCRNSGVVSCCIKLLKIPPVLLYQKPYYLQKNCVGCKMCVLCLISIWNNYHCSKYVGRQEWNLEFRHHIAVGKNRN
jgi:hypothetical protein